MTKCVKCKKVSSQTFFCKVIDKGGIVDICLECQKKFQLPLFSKKEIDWEEVDKPKSVKKRLSLKNNITDDFNEKKTCSEDEKLRKIVEENIYSKILPESHRGNLVRNFHWIIKRKRRSCKFSKADLAEKIFEPVICIDILEDGNLFSGYEKVIRKIENFLKINILIKKDRGISNDDIFNESRIATGILTDELK